MGERFARPLSQSHPGPAQRQTRSAFRILRACYANLAEEPRESIVLEDHHTLPVSADPKKIVTIRLEIEPTGMDLTPAVPEIKLLESGAAEVEDLAGMNPRKPFSPRTLRTKRSEPLI